MRSTPPIVILALAILAGTAVTLAGTAATIVVAVLVAQTVEGVVAEEFLGHTHLRGAPPAGSHQEHELGVGAGTQEAFHEGGADEPGRAGDEDSSSSESVGDHGGSC